MRIKTEVTEAQRQQYDANRELRRANPGFYSNAYSNAQYRYRLTAAERDELDRSPQYQALMLATGKYNWAAADKLAEEMGLSRYKAETKASFESACSPCNCGC
jgi:hypothetical protein